MASHNEYPGSVKLAGRPVRPERVRLDFEPRIVGEPGAAKLEGFSLRLFGVRESLEDEQSEISVDLRPEEWLDLIDSMKAEFEAALRDRKTLDDLMQ